MAVPYTFASATGSIPLSQLDANFNTGITIGNTSVLLGGAISTINNLSLSNVAITSVNQAFPNGYLANSNVVLGTTTLTLGSTTTTVDGLTLSNVTISSGNVTISNVTVSNFSATTANVSGTANVSNLVVIGNATIGGNTTVTGNISALNGFVTIGNTTVGLGNTTTSVGNLTVTNTLVTEMRETSTISATAATGTVQFDALTQVVLYYTTNASGNFTVNFRGNGTTSLDGVMSTGQSLSATFLVTNGATAYYNSAVTIDGSSVTPKWQGGTAPTSGNASSIDSYTYVIIKTGSATFTVLASVTKFA
jgi:hypothetical protein